VCRHPCEGSEARAQRRKRGSERREPDVRELRDLAGADDNKLVAEIGERHLAAESKPSVRPSSDGGRQSERKVASWSGWPVRRDELGLPGSVKRVFRQLDDCVKVLNQAVAFNRKIEIEPIKGVLVSDHRLS
jgi:hypothetical protein